MLLILSFTSKQIVRELRSPYINNSYYLTKLTYYLQNSEKYNTLFFGSSRIYRQINPAVIDSELKEYGISSFNFGAPATFNPEAQYLYEELIKNKSSIRFAFIELTDIMPIANVNRGSFRSYYYMNLEYLTYVTQYYLYEPKNKFVENVKTLYPFLIAYVNNNFVFSNSQVIEHPAEKIYIGVDKNGFYPLDVDLIQNRSKDLFIRNKLFFEDTTTLELKKVKPVENITFSNRNIAFERFLALLIDKSESKGIKLFFIIPPRLGMYTPTSILNNPVIKNRIIDLSSSQKYPEFYLAKYSFDSGHLNSLGADLFSKYLSVEISKKISKK